MKMSINFVVFVRENRVLLRNIPKAIYGLPPYVRMKHSKRAKRLSLRLDPKERVIHLVCPQGCSENKAIRFAQEHMAWIETQMGTLPPPVYFTHGQNIPVFGKDRKIFIHYDPERKSTKINLHADQLEVQTNKEDPTPRITRFLKQEVKQELERLSFKKAEQLGKTVKAVHVRDTKSRWGSCAPDGDINYSWRIIFAPYKALDYLVAHEVAHLKYLDHSKAFWACCESVSDDYEFGKYWIRNHAHELLRYQV